MAGPGKSPVAKRLWWRTTLVRSVALLVLGMQASSVFWPGALRAAPAQPEGYRMEAYDTPVPDALDGATRVSALQVRELQQIQDAVVIDVIPQVRRPQDLPDREQWLPVPHKGLPGALWLPDTGYGTLSGTTERYFRDHLYRATEGQMDHPLVFYCRIDCWMSWNAAKRALSYGYQSVYWFADGTDDWLFEGLDFDVLEPAAGKRQADERG